MAISRGKCLIECPDNGAVGGDAADEIRRLFKGAFLQGSDHPGDALAEGIEHGLDGDPFLLQVNEVALGENAAPGGDSRCLVLTFEGEAGKVLKAYAEAVCLLLEEPPCPRGAERVRRDLPRFFQPVFQDNDQGSLTANLYYGLDGRIQIEQSGGNGQRAAVCRPVEFCGDGTPAGTGNASAINVVQRHHLTEPGEQRVYGGFGVGGYLYAIKPDYLVSVVNEADFGVNRADIYSQ